MAQKNEGSRTLVTRRDLLAQAARGAVLVSVSPYLNYAQTPSAEGGSAPRIRDSFDFGWKFLKGDVPGAQVAEFADANWRDVDLPHDWSIEGPYDEKELSSGPGGYLPTGIAWYRKRFRVPETDRDRVV